MAELLGRPLRLLVLCYELPPVGGGTGVACSQVLRLLSQRRDLQIEVISSSAAREAETFHTGNMRVNLLPVGKRQLSFWQPDELLRWMSGAVRLARRLSAEASFDLCHCWSGLPSGIVGWWLRDLQPYLVSLRGSDVPGYNRRLRLLDPLLLRRLARQVWHGSAGVFAVSPTLRSMAQETAPELTIGVLPNGVDGDFFRPRHNRGRASFVFAGRLIERKGVDCLFEAVRIAAARHPDLRLTVAGDGPERRALLALRTSLGIEAQVSMVGRLERQELADTLGDAGVIVLPAVTDAMPNVVLEGMAAGMAVIATDTSASSIVAGNGQLVPPRDPGALAAAIEGYLDDPALLAEHQRRSRELALERSWENVALDHVQRFRRAMLARPGAVAAPPASSRLRRLRRKQLH
ncbi:MAG: glycosyltransferase family 4 protein [Geminicoccaceae bacterium]